MKIICIVTITFVFLIYESCTPINYVNGKYTNVFAGGEAGEELRFIRDTNIFEYYYRTEGAIKNYSRGTWVQNKKSIYLNGYNEGNINQLNIESKFQDYPDESKSKIVVQYKSDPIDTFTKVEILWDENSKVQILGDTAFVVDGAIRTLRVKSYLAYKGLLLRTSPCIDTLYSPIVKVIDPYKSKMILLSIHVAKSDFYRVKLTDTLSQRNSTTLLWGKKEFKKIRE